MISRIKTPWTNKMRYSREKSLLDETEVPEKWRTYFDVVWIGAALMRSWNTITHTLFFLFIWSGFSPSTDLVRNSIAALLYLGSVFVNGWVLFSVFARRDSNYLLPPREVRYSMHEFMKMLTLSMFGIFVSFMCNKLALSLIVKTEPFFDWRVPVAIILFCAAGVQILRSGWYKPALKTPLSGDLNTLQARSEMQARVLGKINPALNDVEKAELVTLVVQSQQLAGFSVGSLAKFIWNTLLLALILQILQELFSRL